MTLAYGFSWCGGNSRAHRCSLARSFPCVWNFNTRLFVDTPAVTGRPVPLEGFIPTINVTCRSE